MSTDNINAAQEQKSIEEMVFENRNKAYGAYDLRKSYRAILTKSFIIGTIAFIILAIAPLLYMKIKAAQGIDESEVSVELDEILDDVPPPIMEEEEPPPPPPEIEEPEVQQEIVKDMIPEPKPNPPVEEPPKKMEEVKETTIGTINQEGVKSDVYVPPPPPPATGAGKNVEAPIPDTEIVENVDQDAVFERGGINGFRQMFQQNFDQYSVDAEGTVRATVTFVVEKNGTITQINVTGPNKDFNRETERTIKSIRGKWRPGKKNGQEVRSRFRMPVALNFEY